MQKLPLRRMIFTHKHKNQFNTCKTLHILFLLRKTFWVGGNCDKYWWVWLFVSRLPQSSLTEWNRLENNFLMWSHAVPLLLFFHFSCNDANPPLVACGIWLKASGRIYYQNYFSIAMRSLTEWDIDNDENTTRKKIINSRVPVARLTTDGPH